MITGLLIGLFFGGTLGFLLACILTVASRDDEARKRDPSDPYGISERMQRKARALDRAGVTELAGHTRIGLEVDPSRRRA